MSRVTSGWRRLAPLWHSGRPGAVADDRALFSLAAALLLVQLPHVFRLPIWVSLTGGTLIGLKLWFQRNPDNLALRFLLRPVVVMSIAATAAVLLRLDYGYLVGRDPCVAMLFVLVAAKFAEIRRAEDATLLLCLSAFLLMTQFFYSQTLATAVVALPAVIAQAFALSILRDASNPANNTEQIKLVCKLLVQGLPLAALLFIVFPRLPGPLWSLPEDAVGRTGLSDSMSPGSIGTLARSDEVAFRVEFDGAPPRSRQLYWRGPVLAEFDGRNWTASEDQREIEPERPAALDTVHRYTVLLQPNPHRWLFALDNAASLPEAVDARPLGKLMDDGQLIADKPISQVLRYRQSSVLSERWQPARAPGPRNLHLPGANPRSVAFARALYEDSSSARDFAQRVLQHFTREPFRYTLQPQRLEDAPVDEFLFETRAGFCEHYAAAFVVLMRAANIPARVVTGYQGGEMNGDYMIVRQSDAHAWAEAYIGGAWQRFDPTGFVAPSRVEQGFYSALPDQASVLGLAALNSGWLHRARLQWDAVNHHWQRLVVDFDNQSQQNILDALGFAGRSFWQIASIVIGIATVWGVLLLSVPGLSKNTQTLDEKRWSKLGRILRRHRLPRRASESAPEYLQRAAHAWPTQRIRLQQLNDDFSALRFQRLDESRRVRLRSRIDRALFHLALGIALARFGVALGARAATRE